MQTTEKGENYLEGDLNFDRIVNFKDLAIMGEYWWMTESGEPISKVISPDVDGCYAREFQKSSIEKFYGKGKVKKVRIAC